MIIFIILIVLGIGMYFASTSLTAYYIKEAYHAGIFEKEMLPNDEHLWEQTAGMGIVPKWVSLMGLLCYPVTLIGIVGIMWSVFA